MVIGRFVVHRKLHRFVGCQELARSFICAQPWHQRLCAPILARKMQDIAL
jgi:hypothetical protein